MNPTNNIIMSFACFNIGLVVLVSCTFIKNLYIDVVSDLTLEKGLIICVCAAVTYIKSLKVFEFYTASV